jgi:hypothetical protein
MAHKEKSSSKEQNSVDQFVLVQTGLLPCHCGLQFSFGPTCRCTTSALLQAWTESPTTALKYDQKLTNYPSLEKIVFDGMNGLQLPVNVR